MKKIWQMGLIVLLLVLAVVARPVSAQGNEIYVLTIEGPVNQAMTSYFERGIADAEAAGAHAVLIELNTPGGNVSDTLDIMQLFRNAPLPVIVYVGPAGAQAASAGSVITLAAHASGMAPDTVIGAASPVTSSGADIGDTLYRKAVEDLKAVMRNLADGRGAEVIAIAESMIEEATALTGEEAFEVGFTDALAVSRAELLTMLDGLEVMVNDEPRVLQTAGAITVLRPLSSVEAFVYNVATVLMSSAFISILLALGVQALIFEVTTPGGWVAGFIGFVCIGVALYGLGQVPINYFGLALVGVAFVLFVMEIFTPTYGALGITGTITLLVGLLLTFNSPGTPAFARLPVFVAVVITLVTGGVFGLIFTLALAIQSKQPASGQEGMVGMVGRVQQPFTAEGGAYRGMVFVRGARWKAISDEPLTKGTAVQVDEIEGLTLYVSGR